jgi:membrane protein implicated in regulation of membrane protease activity
LSGVILAISQAQVLFSIALGAIALLITFFALYVVSSTMWGDRWVRRPKGQ